MRSDRQIIKWHTFPSSYTYDLAGHVATETRPSGRVLTNCYDAAGRFKSISGQRPGELAKVYASNIAYAPHGALSAMQFVSGRWENRTYNDRLQLIHFGAGTSATDSSWGSYTYDYGTTANNGNVLSHHIVGPNGIDITQNFQYDSLNRILSFTEPVVWENYAYDRYGNRAVTSSMNMPTYNVRSLSDFNTANNRIKQQPYDAAGNWMEYGFTYDAENRPAGSANGFSGDILYDGNGRRVFHDSFLHVSNIFDQLTTVYWQDHRWWPFSISYARDQSADALGSLRIESPIPEPDGYGIGRNDYSPFGATIVEPIYTPYRSPNRDSTGDLLAMGHGFLGKRLGPGGPDGWDLGAREYIGLYGRFVSPDTPFADQMPADPQSWNLYAYARNNPLRFADPIGQSCVDSGGKIVDDKKGSGAIGDNGDGKGCGQVDIKPSTEAERARGEDITPQEVDVQGKQGGILELLTAGPVPRYVENDKPLPGNTRKILTAAYLQTTERLHCLGVPVEFGAGYALFRGGQPVPGSKPFVTGGSSLGTSPISEGLRGLNVRLPFKVPTPVGGLGTGVPFRFARTTNVGAILGRYAPLAGIAGMGLSVVHGGYCVSQ